jgi:hypothetical protein
MTATHEGACACAGGSAVAPARGGAAPYCLALSLGLWALVPKCPMCLVAYMSILGLGSGAALSAYPILRPLCIALVALAAVAVVLQRRALRRSAASHRPLSAGESAGAG